MRNHRQVDRRAFLGLAVGSALALRPDSARAGAPSSSLPEVTSPCPLRSVCAELSRRYGKPVSVDSTLAELRVVWRFKPETPLRTVLGRLSELTGGRVVREITPSGGERYGLRADAATTRLETVWRRESVLRTVRELVQAAREYELGTPGAARPPKGAQTYLQSGRAPQMMLLATLSPAELDRLAKGEEVRVPPASLALPDIERMVSVERFYPSRFAGNEAEARAAQRAAHIEAIRQGGIGLQLDLLRMGSRAHLLFRMGTGRGATVLCWFEEDELGVPPTRRSPYHQLEGGGRSAAPSSLPEAMARLLPADLTAPPDGRWEPAIQELARMAALELLCDAYLCRSPSRIATPGRQQQEAAALIQIEPDRADGFRQWQERLKRGGGNPRVLAPRGMPVTEALDQLCKEYGYLWWEKDGVVYCRARAWMWDRDYEVPEALLQAWDQSLSRRGTVGAGELALLGSLTPLQLNGLTRLGGFSVLGGTKSDSESHQRFYKFFRSLPPGAQSQLLGKGLVLTREQANRFHYATRPPPDEGAPVPVALNVDAVRAPSFTPPLTRVRLRLMWLGDQPRAELPADIDIPHLPSPFGTA